jgi:hypothetical protein
MGRELTRQYAAVFETRTLRRPLRFARDVYASGKLRELSSFVIWELFHRTGLFSEARYLKFSPTQPLILTTGVLEDAEATGRALARQLGSTRRLERSPHNWKLLFIDRNHALTGCAYPDGHVLYSSADGRGLTPEHRFPEQIKSVFVSSRGALLVCVKGGVYRRANGVFTRVLDLGSSESFARHNNAITETPDGTLLLGEYGNVWTDGGWKQLAYIYSSTDSGATWATSDFLIGQGTNKHVHVVKYSRSLNRLLVADGDNYKKLWMSEPLGPGPLRTPRWRAVNRFHVQMGGYTSTVEADGRVFFGTDYQGGTNFLVESSDGATFTKQVVPDPYRRSPIDNMVVRKTSRGYEIWANLPYSSGAGRALLMMSDDGGRTWNRILEYTRRDHVAWLISSSHEPVEDLYFSVEDLETRARVVYRIGEN